MNCFPIANLTVPSAATAMVVSSFSTATSNKTVRLTPSTTFNRLLSLSVLDWGWNCFSIVIIKGGNFSGKKKTPWPSSGKYLCSKMKTAWKFPNRRRLTYCVPTNCRIEGWSSARKAFCPWLHEIYLYSSHVHSFRLLFFQTDKSICFAMIWICVLFFWQEKQFIGIRLSNHNLLVEKPNHQCVMCYIAICTCIWSIWKNCALFQNTPFQAICFDILIGIHHCERVCLYLCARAHCEMLKLLTKNPSDLYMWYHDNHCDCKLLITDLFF